MQRTTLLDKENLKPTQYQHVQPARFSRPNNNFKGENQFSISYRLMIIILKEVFEHRPLGKTVGKSRIKVAVLSYLKMHFGADYAESSVCTEHLAQSFHIMFSFFLQRCMLYNNMYPKRNGSSILAVILNFKGPVLRFTE